MSSPMQQYDKFMRDTINTNRDLKSIPAFESSRYIETTI